MVVARSNGSRTAVESKSNRSFNHDRVLIDGSVLCGRRLPVVIGRQTAQWTRMCRFRLPDCEKRSRQTLH